MSDPLSELLNRILGNALSALGNSTLQTLRVGTTNAHGVDVIANNIPVIRIQPSGELTLLNTSGSSVHMKPSTSDSVFQFPESDNVPGKYLMSNGDGSTQWIDLQLGQKLNIADFTKQNIGLSDVDNTADIDKPLSSRMEAAIAELPTFRDLDTKVDYADFNKSALGLARVENTSDLDKPISSATQLALNLLAQQSYVDAQLALKGNQSDIQYLYGNMVNRADYNKTTIGLGQVDNVADIDKPVSVAQQAALDTKLYVADFNKENIGLGLVDNVADADKPVSGPQQAALDLKVNSADIVGLIAGKTDDAELEAFATSVNLAIGSKLNVSDFTKENIGLGNADNTADVDKPISYTQQAALDTKLNVADFTKDNLGIGNVNNTADIDKPISNDVLAALDLKANAHDVDDAIQATAIAIQGNIVAALGALDKTSVGLGEVDNTADINKPISIAQQTALDLKVNAADLVGLIAGKTDDEELSALSSAVQVGLNSKVSISDFTKGNIGLGRVDNTSDAEKPVSVAQQAAIDAAVATKASTDDMVTVLTVLNAKLDAASFTKNNLGLGNVDNTSDMDKPVSTAQIAYINSVIAPVKPYTSVYNTTNRVYNTVGVNQIFFDAVFAGSGYDTATGLYTAPVTGIYSVYIYGISIKDLVGNLYTLASNGQQMSFYKHAERPLYNGAVGVYLAQGDTLAIVAQITTGSFTTYANGGYSILLMS